MLRTFIKTLGLSLALCFMGQAVCHAAPAKTGTHTPAKGSEERKAILDAMRGVIRKMSGLEVVFVVRHLKANGDWAWAEVDPASADGKQHYESLTGLLHRKNGRWVYVEGPPEFSVCEEDPDCIDPVRYFATLARKYPEASAEIFPKP